MNIRFWGVRGSLPTPLTPGQLKSKVSSIIQRMGPADVATPEARERFLARLPDYLFDPVGGNTPCVEIVSDAAGGERIVLDAGTGIRELGISIREPQPRINIFFSHFHWDHIQGLPFFGPAFSPATTLSFFSPVPDFRRILERQMAPPFFPITMDAMTPRKRFVVLDSRPYRIGGITVYNRRMNHPGGSHAYAFAENGNKVIYSTDTELVPSDFDQTPENSAFFGNATMLIIDSQYTLGEAIEKFNWGHSAFSLATDFAVSWNIRNLVLFHHEPENDDKKVYGMLRSAKWYLNHLGDKNVNIMLAREGMELSIS